MKKKNILIILGQGDGSTYCGELASAYEKGARETDYFVKRVNVSELNFDPILHNGYRTIQELEPDLVKMQNLITWADHIVIIYPNWWGCMPALLKGMWDRMFLPGFAFRFNKKGSGWQKLLKGRSATVFITLNNSPRMAKILFGDNSNEIKKNILEFAGISPVRVHKYGPVEKVSDKKREQWKTKVYKLGKKAK